MPTKAQVLKQIAHDFDLPLMNLQGYARSDALKGKDQGNPYGTAFTVDGNILYVLIRAFRPQRILEIGTHFGGSVNHMAAALIDGEIDGQIMTVDIDKGAGQHIAPDYLDIVEMVYDNIDFYLDKLKENGMCFDFIFEDGAHSEGQVHNIYGALPHILKSGGFIMSHDTATDGVCDYIRNGMRKGGADMERVKFYHIDGTPGFSIYQYWG